MNCSRGCISSVSRGESGQASSTREFVINEVVNCAGNTEQTTTTHVGPRLAWAWPRHSATATAIAIFHSLCSFSCGRGEAHSPPQQMLNVNLHASSCTAEIIPREGRFLITRAATNMLHASSQQPAASMWPVGGRARRARAKYSTCASSLDVAPWSQRSHVLAMLHANYHH